MSEFVEARAYRFLLDKLLLTFEGKSLSSRNEVLHALIFLLSGLDQFWHAEPSLGVAKLSKELLFHCLPFDGRSFW